MGQKLKNNEGGIQPPSLGSAGNHRHKYGEYYPSNTARQHDERPPQKIHEKIHDISLRRGVSLRSAGSKTRGYSPVNYTHGLLAVETGLVPNLFKLLVYLSFRIVEVLT